MAYEGACRKYGVEEPLPAFGDVQDIEPHEVNDEEEPKKGIGARTRVAIWPKAPEYTSDKDLVAVLNLVESWHLDGVRIYHLGLLPWRTTERVFRVLTS